MSAATIPDVPAIRIPKKFSGGYYKPAGLDHVNQGGWSMAGSHVLILVAVTLYWLLFETIPAVKGHWDDLFPWVFHAASALVHGHNPFAVPATFPQDPLWKDARHATRNGILEYELAGGAVLLFFANALRRPDYYPSRLKRLIRWLTGYNEKPDWFDKAACFLHLPNPHQKDRNGNPKKTTPLQLVLSPVSILAAGIPGDLIGFGIFFGGPVLLHLAHVFLSGWGIAPASGTGAMATWESMGLDSFTAKLIGIFGLFFRGRTVILKIGTDLQETLSDIRALKLVTARTRLGRFLHRPPKFWPATYRALVYSKVRRHQNPGSSYEIPQHGIVHRYFIMAFVAFIPVAAWKGWEILAAYKASGGK